MKKKVNVKILGSLSSDSDVTRFIEGTLETNKISKKIEYTERNSDFKETSSIVVISQKTVSVTKLGEQAYTMIFEQGRSNGATISTPYGNIDVIIRCRKCEIIEKKNNITVNLNYDIVTVDNNILNNNNLNIIVDYV